jgi:gas vesicle protein
MTREQRINEESGETEGSGRRGRRGGTAGALVLAAAIGVGVGLLAAPQAGTKTRKVLRKRLSALGEDLGEGYEEVQELSGRARRRLREGAGRLKEGAGRLRERAERLRARGQEALEDVEDDLEDAEEDIEDELGEDEGSSRVGTFLALAAGLAAAFLITSDRAAPARERIREAADTVRERAGEQWERYQRGSGTNGAPAASDAASSTVGGAPQAN